MADTTKKIIRGIVNSRGFTITSAITQWDYGWQFIPEIEDLPATYRLDFSNEEKHGTALPVYCSTDGAEVPTELIDTGKDIWVWFVHIGDGYGITEYKWRIPNHCKPKTEEDEPTPSQQSSIDQLIVRSNEAVESAEQSASEASTSAQASAESARASANSAVQASLSESNAERAKGNAQASAESASASATASAQSASEAQSASTNAETYALNSGNKAVESAQSAQASANSATQAQEYANDASASAQSASGYASQAQTSANTASTKAQDASGYAQTASTKATEASQSASQAFTYKTDAESAKGASQTAQGLAESARDTAVQAKEDAESARDEAQSLVDGISGKVEQIDANTASIESLEDDRYKPYVTDSASGSIASFPDGADDIPLKSLVVDINPVQDLSNGDPSPENICPISGWKGMNVGQTGKNLFGGDAWFGTGGTDDRENRTISGTNSSNLPYIARNLIGKYKTNTSYTLILTMTSTSTNGRPGFQFVYTDGTKIILSVSGLDTTKKTFVIASNANKTLSRIDRTSYSGEKTFYVDECGLFEGALTADDFVPYVGQFIPISWQSEAGTVYGGKLDVLSGILTVTHEKVVVESFSGAFGQDTNGYAVYTAARKYTHNVPYAERVKMNSNIFTYVRESEQNMPLFSYGGNYGATQTQTYILPNTITSLAEANEWLSALETPLECTFYLATPIEIQLDAHTINSLLGQNNIWADTGDTACEYRADTKLFISRLTEPDADMIADSNIVSGQYFMVGNSLYKATANIASGASVIVGTNCTRKSLSEALNEINA